ncbi:RNA polymerase sigma factor [Spirosoma harenae]
MRVSTHVTVDKSLNDEEIIRQYLDSEPTACFETLYNRYVNKVYRQCLSMTKSSEQAEDFTQDIFLKVFDKLDAFQQRSSFSTWLYAITFNYCSNQLRMSKRFRFTSLEDGLKHDIPDPKESSLHKETLRLVKRAMEYLSGDEQRLLELRYEREMSIDELAQLYNIKTDAVKMRLKRSRAKIRLLYNQQSA